MPFISETPNTTKSSRSLLPSHHPHHDPPESSRSISTRSFTRDNNNLSVLSSTIKNFNDRDDFREPSSVSTNHNTNNNSNGSNSNTNNSNLVPVRSFDLSEDPSFWNDHNVQVIIRLRPLSSSELSLQGYNRCVRQESSQTITWTGHPESRFTFDVVADETISQEKLFNVAGVPMVENCVAGYNSCMFAYGQTGSGKTHTMLGDIEGGTRRHSVNCGMTPRVFEYLFSRIQKEKEARREEKMRFNCKCSFLEIYNEQILDLLNPSSANLQLREDLKKGVYVENLAEFEVTSAREAMQQLLDGAANRKVAATNMNRASSRSHSVFTFAIESTWESQGVTHHRFARLNLVDLAGSERQKSSGAEGERLKEATNINKSLSTLGLVIMNLVSISNGKSLHVPYRDSKLTFLLQDSLGGNSKTIIIANISPSTCCSLETLSTLKFAQRAKFIKNNAIVNEDASGDVLAMRMQIQQLKKEVSQLRGLLNGGGGSQDNDCVTLGLLGSPGPFNWEGLNTLTPLTSDRRPAQKREYEVALVGAFRREKDKDMAVQALTAENKAAMQLAKQREDEIQGLKMRLRFREAGIKRLEAVASGKINAEAHLLKEKEELLREIEVLRAQVDRNQEVTRFAMENLRLKEEIRRLKSFYEESEMERMNEQITTLQNKLLEALDWKLMNECGPSHSQIGSPGLLADKSCDMNHINSSKESRSPWQTSLNEENEFLRVQAIQNQAEIDSIRKKLDACMEEKATLERNIREMKMELEDLKDSKEAREDTIKMQTNVPLSGTDDGNKISFNDQLELKAMVEAIAAASQREAEAHETAINLAKENDELRAKVKVLIEDNHKLIDLYETAAAETKSKATDSHAHLEHQLSDLHDENEKLMSMFEKAMQERDEFKKLLSISLNNKVSDKDSEFPEKLLEVDERDYSLSRESNIALGTSMEIDLPTLSHEDEETEENESFQRNLPNNSDQSPSAPLAAAAATDQMDLEFDEPLNLDKTTFELSVEHLQDKKLAESPSVDKSVFAMENISSNLAEPNTYNQCHGEILDEDPSLCVGAYSDTLMKEKLVRVREELDKARERVSSSSEIVAEFGVLEKAILEVDELSREIEATKDLLQLKEQEVGSQKLQSSEMKERKALVSSKLAALKVSLSCISSSISYYEQREKRARTRVDSSLSSFNDGKVILARLEAQIGEIDFKRKESQETETELRKTHLYLKSKLEEENQRLENERVLFAIDNIERVDNPPWKQGSKATELLKSEEDKTKLQNEIKQSREKLSAIIKETADLNKKRERVYNDIQRLSLEMEKTSKIVEESEFALQNVMNEKELLLETRETGKTEIDSMVVEYQLCTFEEYMTNEELEVLQEDMQLMFIELERLELARAASIKRATERLGGEELITSLPSEKMRQELEEIWSSIFEAKSLVVTFCRKLDNQSSHLVCC